MPRKKWTKPRVKELDILMTEALFGDLATATGVYLLFKDGSGSSHSFS